MFGNSFRDSYRERGGGERGPFRGRVKLQYIVLFLAGLWLASVTIAWYFYTSRGGDHHHISNAMTMPMFALQFPSACVLNGQVQKYSLLLV